MKQLVKTETPRARKLKQIYLDLGPERTIKKTYETYKKMYGKCSNQYLELLSANFGWVQAAKTFDIAQENELKSKHLVEIAKMQRRHAQEAQLLQKLAIDKLKKAKPEQLRLQDCAKFLSNGIRIEREANGLKDKTLEVNNEVTVETNNVEVVNKLIVNALSEFPEAKEKVINALMNESNKTK